MEAKPLDEVERRNRRLVAILVAFVAALFVGSVLFVAGR
jgi:hypothetical protein